MVGLVYCNFVEEGSPLIVFLEESIGGAGDEANLVGGIYRFGILWDGEKIIELHIKRGGGKRWISGGGRAVGVVCGIRHSGTVGFIWEAMDLFWWEWEFFMKAFEHGEVVLRMLPKDHGDIITDDGIVGQKVYVAAAWMLAVESVVVCFQYGSLNSGVGRARLFDEGD